MKIVIDHLTRMQKGFICVAGVDLATGQHVRPMLRCQMPKELLARYGGPFDIGRVVELGWTKYQGTRPETEDYLFHRSEVRSLGEMPASEFWQRIEHVARAKLGEIFGKDLCARGLHCYAVDAGRGCASLGCYIAPGQPHLFLDRRDQLARARVRIQFQSGPFAFDLAVTDIRLYGADHVTPDAAVLQRMAKRLEVPGGVILGVGLSRAFRAAPDEPALHWLQVNNLHFEEDPVWQLG